MNSLKTMLLLAVLATVAYGMYVSVNTTETPPTVEGEDWVVGPPSVSLPSDAVAAPVGMTSPDMAPLPGPAPSASAAPAPPFSPAPMPPEVAPQENARAPLPADPPLPPAGDVAAAAVPPLKPAAKPSRPKPPAKAGAPQEAGPQDAPKAAAAKAPAKPRAAGPVAIRPPFAQFLADARHKLDQGHLASTLGVLSAHFNDPEKSPAENAALTALLDQVAGSVIYSTGHHLEPAYVVRQGETLEQIAKRYQVPWQLLGKINGISDPLAVRPGQEIKVVRGPFRADVRLDSHEMVLWLQDLYAGRFPIGVGTDQPLPEGSFKVRQKERDPTYRSPTGEVIEAGSANNPLGRHRLDLGDSVAIHGTNNPAAVGTTGGPGAIRLGGRDAGDVFDILSVGSRVAIIRR